jgi:type I restriction enzyme S subunit
MGKYQAYSGYKDSQISWLREIPQHWQLNRFKNIFKIKKRIAGKLGFEILSITQRGIKIKDTESGDGQLSMDYSKYQIVLKNDFAMNHMDLLTGFVDISQYDGVTSPDYRVFTLEDSQSFDGYFLYLLQACYTEKIFYPLGQGASTLGRWRLPTEAFNEFVSPIPPKNEQQAIANFLDHETAKIDTLIEQQQQLIQLLKEKRQAVISHAVTKGLNPNAPMKDSGVEWLGEVPAHWEVKRLKNVAEVVDCRNKTPEYFDDGEYLVIRTTNVKQQVLNLNGALYTNEANFKIWTQRGVPPAGSILFTREAPAGEVCLVPEGLKFCLGQRMMNFICHNSQYNSYLFDFLLSDCLERYIQSVSHGSTVSHLRVEQVENIPVLVPPKNEAHEISQNLGVIKNKYLILTEEAEVAIQLMQERRTALISAAVTGKIDVRNWQASQQ